MATGTGKTFTTVNQIYRLMKSGVARRVLFLVDRRALAAQAVNAFAAFEAEPGLKFDKVYEVFSQRFRREDLEEGETFDPRVMPNNYLTDPQPGHAFAYVCTIQRMAINLFGRQAGFNLGDEELDDDAGQLEIPIHAFDAIIADECHRGYTKSELSVWRNTLDHFDAVKIGLTATPAAHTKAYFNEVVYRYEYERAVREGYLVDYDVVTVRSNVRMNGLFLKEGEQVGLVDTETGTEQLDLLEDERQFDTTQIEREATAIDSNRKIIEEVRKYAQEHETRYGRLPKTLIFAVNDLPHRSHADQLVLLAREVFGQGDDFVQKITGSPTVDRPLQRIREFRNRPKPAIVVTVDMLSTGVDIPDLEFIVFLRPVKSRILFEQMLGRGTRKGEKFPDKSHFTVFDCFDGTLLEYFRTASAFTREPPDKPSRTIAEVIQDIWQNRDREYNVRCLVKRLQRIDKEMPGEARELFAAYLEDGDLAKYARELPRRLAADFVGTMELLRNQAFQDLLVNYPRAQRGFVKAYEAQDEVTSQWLIRDGTGKEYRPEDYLTAFARYVQENPDQIEAIRILLNRPREWGTDALSELKQKLAATNLRFTVENLQGAHAAQYHKSLIEIISMIKHAAHDEEPLFTAAERVERALAKVTAGKDLSQEQSRWLERIHEHLVANLSISREDFEFMPVFEREGGWRKANLAFGGTLAQWLVEINEAIAA
jgi:type I restriction enzyme R subunit